jgi:hypothetical protein
MPPRARFVPGRWIEVRAPGTTWVQRRSQPGHWAVPGTEQWVPKPDSNVDTVRNPPPPDPIAFDPRHPYVSPAYTGGLSAGEMIAEDQATASYAAGMPAVVARATQEQVAQRMAEAAAVDADYRAQLVDVAAERGGIYNDALNNLHRIEQRRGAAVGIPAEPEGHGHQVEARSERAGPRGAAVPPPADAQDPPSRAATTRGRRNAMAEPTTGPNVITLQSGDRFDEIRTALAALELASLRPVDRQKIAIVRDVISDLEKRLAEARLTASLVLDDRQLAETQKRDRGLDGEAKPADTERDAS